jgi:hypothetical protein
LNFAFFLKHNPGCGVESERETSIRLTVEAKKRKKKITGEGRHILHHWPNS